MKINQIKQIPAFAREKIKEKGIPKLNPPQKKAVEKGVLEKESMIISSPTASGKTLIATMAISKILKEGKKALYLVPLKALASEKYKDYKKFFEDQPIDVALSLGDKDSSDSWLENKDLIILTVEKLDSLLRHNPSWIKDVELVVEDEIHLLNDASRGPTLEVTLTRLQELMEFQLVGLSATISNCNELADWLDAKLIESDYRPAKLKKGVLWENNVEFYNSKPEIKNEQEFKTGKDKLEEQEAKNDIEKNPISSPYGKETMNLLKNTLDQDKQAITFVNSRKSAEKEAERLGKVAKKSLTAEEKNKLEEISEEIKTALSTPTKQCKRLSKYVKKGSAFHHAGLVSKQRELIEKNFREGKIKSISATPTLAMGVSLPSYRIILRDLKRYTNSGLNWIPTLEYYQMAGRAGRPEYESEGQAIAIAKNSGNRDKIIDRYIFGEPEKIYSKLAVEPVLRIHALSLVATGFTSSKDQVLNFFSQTFYAQQYGEQEELKDKIVNVLQSLEDYEFLTINKNKIEATKLGKRVSELYLDPDSAHYMLENLKKARQDQTKPISYLFILANCAEMKPLFRVKKNEQEDFENLAAQAEEFLLEEPPEPWDYEYEQYLNQIKTSTVLYKWIRELKQDKIMDEFGVTPGGLRAKINNADWLLYSGQELCNLKGWKQQNKKLKKLRTRLKHGIKTELLPLVRIKNIGRVRARKLYKNGIKERSDIIEVSYEKLKKTIGEKTAKKVKKQVGEENIFDREKITDYFKKDNPN